MRKILFIIIPFIFAACVSTSALNQSFRLSEGMTMDEVVQIMGKPCASELTKGVTEWHYCSTGITTDEFVAVFFKDGCLIAVKKTIL